MKYDSVNKEQNNTRQQNNVNSSFPVYFEVESLVIIDKPEYKNLYKDSLRYQSKPISISYSNKDVVVSMCEVLILSNKEIINLDNQNLFNEWLAKSILVKIEELDDKHKLLENVIHINYIKFDLLYSNLENQNDNLDKVTVIGRNLYIHSNLAYNDLIE